MAKVELVMPKMGESIIEATILSWSKEVGETIEMDETVLEIATDKVDSEVPSPVEGKLLEKKYKEGDVVPVGEVIALIETESVQEAIETPTPSGKNPDAPEPIAAIADQPVVTASSNNSSSEPLKSRSENGRFYSPLVLSIAREEGISMQELERISGTGRDARVTKKDILSYLNSPKPALHETTSPSKIAKKPAPVQSSNGVQIAQKSFSHSGEYDIIEMDRMRKMIAENMVYSKHISAHVTSFVEADVTPIVQWREKVKKSFQEKYGQKLTYTPIFIEAIIKTLQSHPTVNISIDGNNILLKKDINIGVAVALPNDNLIVPVIKHADRMNLLGLTTAVNDLAKRARENKLKPEELEGGTYTVSNVGTFGNVMGTPIILQPQVAIMATGAIRKKPAVIETPEGDFIGIRHMMFLSHSYDHRIVDGALGGRFVKAVSDQLERWDINREI